MSLDEWRDMVNRFAILRWIDQTTVDMILSFCQQYDVVANIDRKG